MTKLISRIKRAIWAYLTPPHVTRELYEYDQLMGLCNVVMESADPDDLIEINMANSAGESGSLVVIRRDSLEYMLRETNAQGLRGYAYERTELESGILH